MIVVMITHDYALRQPTRYNFTNRKLIICSLEKSDDSSHIEIQILCVANEKKH